MNKTWTQPYMYLRHLSFLLLLFFKIEFQASKFWNTSIKKKKRYIKNATPHLVNDLTYLWRPVKNAMSSLRYWWCIRQSVHLGLWTSPILIIHLSLICTFPTSYTHLSTLQLVTYIHCISGTSWWITLRSHNSEPPKKEKNQPTKYIDIVY